MDLFVKGREMRKAGIDGEENGCFSNLTSAAVLLSCLGADVLQNIAQRSCGLDAAVGSPSLLLQREKRWRYFVKCSSIC